jgi:hypothetical protein
LEVVRQLAEEKRKAGFVMSERQPNGAFNDVYARREVKTTRIKESLLYHPSS